MLEKISDIRTDFEIFITDYGLRIGHLYDADSNFIKTEFIFAGGSSVDGDLKGISHFLEHLISPTQKLSNKVADYGLTNLNAYTIYRYNYYPYWQLLDLDLIKKIFSFYFQHFFSLGKSFLTKEAFL